LQNRALEKPNRDRKFFEKEKILEQEPPGGKKMTTNKTTVFGVYSTPQGVEHAGNVLVTSGFSDSDISVLLPEDADGHLAAAGGFLLSVYCNTSDQVERAKRVMENTMAQGVSSYEAASSESALSLRWAHLTTDPGRVN
jgi:hypothetical protein